MRRLPLTISNPKLHLKRTFQRCAASWGLLLASYLWFVPFDHYGWMELGLGLRPFEARPLANLCVAGIWFIFLSGAWQAGRCWVEYKDHGFVRPRPESVRRR